MQDLSDDERKEALGEVLFDELRLIREGIADLPTRTEFNELRADVEELKSGMQVVKAAVTDQSKTLNDHEQRISTLEAA